MCANTANYVNSSSSGAETAMAAMGQETRSDGTRWKKYSNTSETALTVSQELNTSDLCTNGKRIPNKCSRDGREGESGKEASRQQSAEIKGHLARLLAIGEHALVQGDAVPHLDETFLANKMTQGSGI